MTDADDLDARAYADLALLVYLDDRIRGRRVSWLGPASKAVRRRLGGVASATRFDLANVESADVLIIPDASRADVASESDLRRLAVTVGADGVCVVATPAGGTVRYEDVFAWMQGAFASVRVLGVLPVVGYGMVDFERAGDAAGVTIDGSLVGDESESVERFVVLGSHREAVVDAYLVAQIPADDGGLLFGGRAAELDAEASEARAAATVAREHAEQLERRLAAGSDELVELRSRVVTLTGRLASVERELESSRATPDDGVDGDHARLEAALREQTQRTRELGAEVERRALIVRDLTEELARLRAAPVVEETPEASDPSAAQREAAQREAAQREAAQDELTEPSALRVENARLEAERTALSFRVDELRAESLAHVERVGELEHAQAVLEGKVRGFRSRAAEAEEMHAHAEGLLSLAKADLEAAQDRTTRLEREGVELQKQLELERIRAAHESSSVPAELEAALLELDFIRGERSGLEFRVRDREAALAAVGGLPSELRADRDRARDEADRLRDELVVVRARETDLTLRVRDLDARHAETEARLNETASALAAREALAKRLAADVADLEREKRAGVERLAELGQEAEGLRKSFAALGERLAQLESVEKRARDLETKIGGVRAELMRAARVHDADARLFADVRSVSVELRDSLGAGVDARPPGFTAVGDEAPGLEELRASADDTESKLRAKLETSIAELEALRGRFGHLGRSTEAREELLQTLALQIEDRDERLRELEEERAKPVSGKGGGPLQKEMVTLQERVARLSDQLLREREARRAAESAVGIAAPAADPETELNRLHEMLSAREGELLSLRGKVAGGERELHSVRDMFAQARAGLEILLNQATSRGDPGTAERVGSILRLLSRLN